VLIATCNANNAELAQQILATYMDEAIKWHIEKYDDQKAYDEARRAHEEGLKAYEAAQLTMREFLEREARVSQFDEAKTRAGLGAIESGTRVNSLDEDISIKRRLLQEFNKQLADPEKLPPTKIQKVRQSISQLQLTELQTRLVDERIRLTELQNLLRDPNDAQIAAQQKRLDTITQTIERLAEENKDVKWVDEIIDNPQYLGVLADRDRLERELWTLEAQVKEAQKLHDEKDAERARILALEPKYETLRSALQLAGENKDAAQTTWKVAQQKRALGLGNYSSLKAIQEASLPLEKEGPNRGKLLIGGLFVGLFLGLGIVVLRALPDNVVRTRDDLERMEGLAVIGIMPRLERVNLRRHVALREQGW
jgi:uncharacterized protein involved in exopolysaccharide biosynthesis